MAVERRKKKTRARETIIKGARIMLLETPKKERDKM